MRLLVGLTSLLASFAIATLTVYEVKSAGGADILTVTSVCIVVLLALAGIGALRSDR
ncbi:MAG: hypothetical protein NTY57_01565 [Solirubrobacterales bacterium]|nr:hypothetical protein [Solirubrobacterales bacterium]